MAVVTKERRLLQLAKIEIHDIHGNPPPRAPSSPAHLLACLPEKFDGTCGPATQAFLQQTGLYCLAHPDKFPDNGSKIIFMLTNLSGNTAKWDQMLNQQNPDKIAEKQNQTEQKKVNKKKQDEKRRLEQGKEGYHKDKS
ncbi:uncharacterized protein VP01_1730g3 [Puccinia sorghi]|uniref:DUF4939 domain-containing protein n=1 Tax=Puccinia sorghi TaxID=27349 RepID=A0A0L6VFB4_9BASI|nr:uncharacterized protein VP01_1730g3 [Puccinia sorghi]